MIGQNVKSLKRAIDSLMKAELAALERITQDNSEANREQYREIHDTLETVRSDLRRQHSVVGRLLKLFHLAP